MIYWWDTLVFSVVGQILCWGQFKEPHRQYRIRLFQIYIKLHTKALSVCVCGCACLRACACEFAWRSQKHLKAELCFSVYIKYQYQPVSNLQVGCVRVGHTSYYQRNSCWESAGTGCRKLLSDVKTLGMRHQITLHCCKEEDVWCNRQMRCGPG